MRNPFTLVPLVLPRSTTTQVLSAPRRTSGVVAAHVRVCDSEVALRQATNGDCVLVQEHAPAIGKGQAGFPLAGRHVPRNEQCPRAQRSIGLDHDAYGAEERVPLLLGMVLGHLDELCEELRFDGLEAGAVSSREQHAEGVRGQHATRRDRPSQVDLPGEAPTYLDRLQAAAEHPGEAPLDEAFKTALETLQSHCRPA